MTVIGRIVWQPAMMLIVIVEQSQLDEAHEIISEALDKYHIEFIATKSDKSDEAMIAKYIRDEQQDRGGANL